MSNLITTKIHTIDLTIQPRRSWWQSIRRAVLRKWLAWTYKRDIRKMDRGEGILMTSVEDLYKY